MTQHRRCGRGRMGVLLLVAVLLSVSQLAGCHGSRPAPAPPRSVTIEYVVDGDTAITTAGERVRVLGIDAPELAHDGAVAECGACDARSALARAVLHHQVQLVADPDVPSPDRYGRTLSYLQRDGRDVGRDLVDKGWAAAWSPTSSQPARFTDYVHVQYVAQAARRGSWARCATLGRTR